MVHGTYLIELDALCLKLLLVLLAMDVPTAAMLASMEEPAMLLPLPAVAPGLALAACCRDGGGGGGGCNGCGLSVRGLIAGGMSG